MLWRCFFSTCVVPGHVLVHVCCMLMGHGMHVNDGVSVTICELNLTHAGESG